MKKTDVERVLTKASEVIARATLLGDEVTLGTLGRFRLGVYSRQSGFAEGAPYKTYGTLTFKCSEALRRQISNELMKEGFCGN